MAVFKCKMCGAPLDVSSGTSTVECEYCGSQQTLPKLNDDRLTAWYELANDLRREFEFDRAAEQYQKIVEEDPTDAEAYWSQVLCRYGIQYVQEDEYSKKRKPTINRAQMSSIFSDANYLAAMRYADEEQKRLYRAEAEEINRILTRHQEIIQNEPPYDVFICYKESDARGNRTEDSLKAQEMYMELTKEGYKVFYAPVTLETKGGQEYEPYIFSAIMTAKVMIVVATKKEYLHAVWVKNEWSRFLSLCKDDPKRCLLPVYQDMDPYAFKEVFGGKQAYDMTKMGFMLDLSRTVGKAVRKDEPAKPVVQEVRYERTRSNGVNIENFLRRVVHFMEDGDWSSADIYCEKVLDADSENGMAYLYKLMIQCRVSSMNGLRNQDVPLERKSMYKNAVRYADEQTAAQLTEFNRLQKETEQRRQKEAELAEQRRRVLSSLRSAQSNAQDHIRNLLNQKEQLEVYSANKSMEAQGITKEKKSIRTPAIISIITALLTLYMYVILGMDTDVVVVVFIINTVFAAILAGRRLNSRLAAIILNIISVSIVHFGLTSLLSGCKALYETRTLSKKDIEKEQAQIRIDLANIEVELNKARASLSEINTKLEEFV